MPLYPPRKEPIRKIQILEKRVMELLKCIRTNASEEKTKSKAEKIREAQLNLLKARLALIKPYKLDDKTEEKEILRIKLLKEIKLWQSKTLEVIIHKYKLQA